MKKIWAHGPGLRWLGAAFGLIVMFGTLAGVATADPEPATITIEPPVPMRMGDDPSGTIVAHLTQVGGQPVAGARLSLFIDGTAAGSTLTNGDGSAQLAFRRELLPGDHEVEIRFPGSRVASAAAAIAQLSVLPVDDSRLTLDPLPVLQVGHDPSVTLVARLRSNSGEPVSGARLEVLVDATPATSGVTDAQGVAQLTFRRPLAAGEHRVDVKFRGSRIAGPTSTTAQLSVQAVGDTRLTISPLPTLQVGQDPSVDVAVRLVSGGGEPLAGARLALHLDDVPLTTGLTDADGTARLSFRRELAAGDHVLEVKFDGSRTAGPASASAQLSVRPIAGAGLSVEPLPRLQVGQDPTVNVVAHLISESGEGVPGARLSLLVDGAPAASGVTDAGGVSRLTFRRELAAGDHEVEVRFAGSRQVAAASATAKLSVSPVAVSGLTIAAVPRLQVGRDPGGTVVARLASDAGQAVAGARLSLLIDGVPAGSAVTDAAGTAQLTFRRELAAGDHQVEVQFAGSRAAAAAAATARLTVADIAVHGLTLDPLPTVQVGQDPTVTLVARMSGDSGEPVPGARLDLLVDGTPAGVGLTDAAGIAQLTFRRQLPAGEHQIEVRFAGSRLAGPSSVSQTLTVLPAVGSRLTIDPLPKVRIGLNSVVTVVARLADESGAPVPGARLELVVDGTQQRVASTDATGAARLQFPPDLLPGDHEVEVRFGGTRGLAPVTASEMLNILPHQLDVQVTPPEAGARIAVNGRVFTSDDQGLVRLSMDKPGAYHLEVLPWETAEPGKQLEFGRWGDEVFSPARDIVVPQVSRLEVGFNTSYLVSLSYLDTGGRPVDLGRIASATVTSSVGAGQTFLPGEAHWLLGSRVVRRAGGLGETPIQYAVDAVQMEGANVVNSKEQRFYPSANLDFSVNVLLYSMRIDAHTVLLGAPVGSGISLRHPDGRTQRYEFGPDGALDLRLLPRGQYIARVIGPGGLTFPQPIALSRDQRVELKVVSYGELIAVVALLTVLAVSLLLVGRREQLRAAWVAPPALTSLVARFVRGGQVRPPEEGIP